MTTWKLRKAWKLLACQVMWTYISHLTSECHFRVPCMAQKRKPSAVVAASLALLEPHFRSINVALCLGKRSKSVLRWKMAAIHKYPEPEWPWKWYNWDHFTFQSFCCLVVHGVLDFIHLSSILFSMLSSLGELMTSGPSLSWSQSVCLISCVLCSVERSRLGRLTCGIMWPFASPQCPRQGLLAVTSSTWHTLSRCGLMTCCWLAISPRSLWYMLNVSCIATCFGRFWCILGPALSLW